MNEESKKILTVTYPLIVNTAAVDELNKRLRIGCDIYNAMLCAKLKRLRQMEQTRAWRENQKIIQEEYALESADEDIEKNKEKRRHSERLKAAFKAKQDMLKENGFTKFSFVSDVLLYAKPYARQIPSKMASLSIGAPMWHAFEKYFFSNGQKIHFKKYRDFNSLETDNKSGLRLLTDEKGKDYLFLSNRNSGAKPLRINLYPYQTDYDKAMRSGDIKIIRVVRRHQNNKDRFYAQAVVNVVPFVKTDGDGSALHPFGTGAVGLAIWQGTMYAVSDSQVKKFDLMPNNEAYQMQKNEMNRELTILRQELNPDNFEEDGQIKKGIIDSNGKRVKLTWTYNKRYYRLRNRKREMERKHTENMSILKNKIVYELLMMGDEFFIYDTSYRTDKPEWDEEEPLTQKEYRKKKKRRKSIQDSAPAELIVKLNNKLAMYDKPAVTKVHIKDKDYWYDHTKDMENPAAFTGDMVRIADDVIPHTAYRAFLVRFYNGTYNNDDIQAAWNLFLNALK